MSNFKVPQYNGLQYYQMQEQLKKEHPNAYNNLQIQVARNQNPTSEIVRYTDANGNNKSVTNTGAGFVSGTDPVGRDIIMGVALGKPMEWAGSKIINASKKLLGKNQIVHDITETEFGELLSRLSRKKLSEEEKIDIISKASDEFFDYIGSEKHLEQIMKSGKSREDAIRIANAMNTNARWSNIGMSPDLIEFADNLPRTTSGRTFIGKGDFTDEFGETVPDIRVALNSNIQSPDLIRETITHELGHASTLGYDPNSKISKALSGFSPEVKEIHAHNSTLRPKRKKQYVNVEDPELEKTIKYLEGVDEYSTRARNRIINEDNQDVEKLYKYFTRPSVNNLIKYVWGLAPVIGVAPSVIDNE